MAYIVITDIVMLITYEWEPGKILIGKRNPSPNDDWEFPFGRLQGMETLQEAATRLAKEKTNLTAFGKKLIDYSLPITLMPVGDQSPNEVTKLRTYWIETHVALWSEASLPQNGYQTLEWANIPFVITGGYNGLNPSTFVISYLRSCLADRH